jgi:hypothetical protein
MKKDEIDSKILDFLLKQEYFNAVRFVRNDGIVGPSMLKAKSYVDEIMNDFGLFKNEKYRICES